MKRIRTAALVVNIRARRGRLLWTEARRGLDALGIDHEAHAVRDPHQLDDIVERALARRLDVLILGGGDGTVSSVVDRLVGQDVPLGLLPCGTANSFARSLGLPLVTDEALNLIAAGHVRRVDLGRIDSDHFANCAALGMATQIARTIPHGLKRWGGRLGYALWVLVALGSFAPFRVRVGDKDFDALEVRIANGSYQGGAEMIPDAEVDSGEIVVQVVTGTGRAALARHWLAGLLRLPAARRGVCEMRARALRIDATPAQWISIDGEVLARTPVTASVAAGAILMLLPPLRFDRNGG